MHFEPGGLLNAAVNARARTRGQKLRGHGDKPVFTEKLAGTLRGHIGDKRGAAGSGSRRSGKISDLRTVNRLPNLDHANRIFTDSNEHFLKTWAGALDGRGATAERGVEKVTVALETVSNFKAWRDAYSQSRRFRLLGSKDLICFSLAFITVFDQCFPRIKLRGYAKRGCHFAVNKHQKVAIFRP